MLHADHSQPKEVAAKGRGRGKQPPPFHRAGIGTHRPQHLPDQQKEDPAEAGIQNYRINAGQHSMEAGLQQQLEEACRSRERLSRYIRGGGGSVERQIAREGLIDIRIVQGKTARCEKGARNDPEHRRIQRGKQDARPQVIRHGTRPPVPPYPSGAAVPPRTLQKCGTACSFAPLPGYTRRTGNPWSLSNPNSICASPNGKSSRRASCRWSRSWRSTKLSSRT